MTYKWVVLSNTTIGTADRWQTRTGNDGAHLQLSPYWHTERTMKAIVYHEYGSPDVLQLEDIDKPLVKDDEVLVRVHAASVNRLDWHLVRGSPYISRLQAGRRKPKDRVPGADVAGQVEAVGKHVTRFQPGHEVFGSLFGHGFGAFAEYVSVSDDLLELKPANLSFEQAAAVPVAALTRCRACAITDRSSRGTRS